MPRSICCSSGYLKKIIIADSLGSLSSTAFHAAATGQALTFNTPLYIQGFYLFAFEIYADFSGYIDIARASAALLGIQLPENFKQPYLATSLGVFWNRWNMTLTQWFREYLYFPLTRALSQRTERRHPQLVQVITNLITMLLIGLWHGPAWTFIAWGGWHGCLLSIESMLKIKPASVRHSLIQGIITFHLVGIGWVLFRSESLTAAVNYLHALFSFNNMEWLPYYLPSIILTAALVFGIDLLTVYQARLGRLSYLKEFRPALVIASVILLSSLFLLTFARGSAVRPFIYGQF